MRATRRSGSTSMSRHAAHVEHDAVVAQRQAGDGVAAGAHGDRQVAVAGERQRRDDVVDGEALDHEPRPAVDHRVEERAGVLVGGVTGLVHAAEQAEAQLVGAGGEADLGHGRKRRGATGRAPSPEPAIPRDGRKRPAAGQSRPWRVAWATAAARDGVRSLRPDVRHVAVHGVRAEEQALGDLGVAQPLRDEAQDLDLARAELAAAAPAPRSGARRAARTPRARRVPRAAALLGVARGPPARRTAPARARAAS